MTNSQRSQSRSERQRRNLVYREIKLPGFRSSIGSIDKLRKSLSIPSNIAEGMERNSDKETINFLSYAKGSCGELRTQIYVGMKIGYIAQETGKKWVAETKEISAMLIGLEKSLMK